MSHVHNIIISLGPSQTIFPHLRFCFLVSLFSYQSNIHKSSTNIHFDCSFSWNVVSMGSSMNTNNSEIWCYKMLQKVRDNYLSTVIFVPNHWNGLCSQRIFAFWNISHTFCTVVNIFIISLSHWIHSKRGTTIYQQPTLITITSPSRYHHAMNQHLFLLSCFWNRRNLLCHWSCQGITILFRSKRIPGLLGSVLSFAMIR